MSLLTPGGRAASRRKARTAKELENEKEGGERGRTRTGERERAMGQERKRETKIGAAAAGAAEAAAAAAAAAAAGAAVVAAAAAAAAACHAGNRGTDPRPRAMCPRRRRRGGCRRRWGAGRGGVDTTVRGPKLGSFISAPPVNIQGLWRRRGAGAATITCEKRRRRRGGGGERGERRGSTLTHGPAVPGWWCPLPHPSSGGAKAAAQE